MRSFERGIQYYTRGTATISFPEGDVVCYRCPLMGVELKSDREYCRMTGEYLVAVRSLIGGCCPLKFNIQDGGEIGEHQDLC